MQRPSTLLMMLSTLLIAEPAFAQATSPQDAARSIGEEGLALFGKGQWQEAFDHFRKAEELFHAPTLVLYMARCKVGLNQWLEARDLYRRIDNEKLPAHASAAFVSAKKQAAQELAALMPQIPVLVLLVENAPESGVQIRLDGHEVDPYRLRNGMEVNPGEHVVHVSAPGRETAVQTVNTAPGQASRSSVSLVAATEVSKAIPADNKPSAPPPPPADPFARVDPLWVGIGAGATVVAATVGVIGVVVANNAASDLDDLARTCPLACPKDDWDAANNERVTYTNLAFLSFITAGVAAVATGSYLGVTLLEGDDGTAKAAIVPAGPGVGGLSVTGKW